MGDEVESYLKEYSQRYEKEYSRRKANIIIRMYPPSKLTPGASWLDLGCGGGFYSVAAAKRRVTNLIVSDVQPIPVKATIANMLHSFRSKVEGVVLDAAHLPFKDMSFDLILCIDVIEHVKNDKGLLVQVKSALKKGGFLVVSTQNSSSLNYLIENFGQSHVLKKRDWMGWDSTHVRFYNYATLRQLLVEVGYQSIRVAGSYYLPYLLIGFLLDRANVKLAKPITNLLWKLNDVIERWSTKPFFNAHGWGLIFFCKKDESVRAHP